MTKHYCDLCGEEVKNGNDSRLYELPIAVFDDENMIRNLDELLLCKKCERSVYKSITNIASKDCLGRLRRLAKAEYEDEEW